MTTKEVLIRDEKKSDFTTVSDETIAAFETMEISNHSWRGFSTSRLSASKAIFWMQ